MRIENIWGGKTFGASRVRAELGGLVSEGGLVDGRKHLGKEIFNWMKTFGDEENIWADERILGRRGKDLIGEKHLGRKGFNWRPPRERKTFGRKI